MGPTFYSKNGVRYRFYISTAFRRRKHAAGSVRRISAPEIEGPLEAAVRKKFDADEAAIEDVLKLIQHITATGKIQIFADKAKRPLELPWESTPAGLCPGALQQSKLDAHRHARNRGQYRAHAFFRYLSTNSIPAPQIIQACFVPRI
jgi:hypothetical protein